MSVQLQDTLSVGASSIRSDIGAQQYGRCGACGVTCSPIKAGLCPACHATRPPTYVCDQDGIEGSRHESRNFSEVQRGRVEFGGVVYESFHLAMWDSCRVEVVPVAGLRAAVDVYWCRMDGSTEIICRAWAVVGAHEARRHRGAILGAPVAASDAPRDTAGGDEAAGLAADVRARIVGDDGAHDIASIAIGVHQRLLGLVDITLAETRLVIDEVLGEIAGEIDKGAPVHVPHIGTFAKRGDHVGFCAASKQRAAT